MTVYPIQANFVRGELSPKLAGRVDIELYAEALADATNWLVMPQGGLTRRPGTIFIGAIRDETEKGRLVEFEFDEEQAYALLFNDGKVWFYTLGAQVTLTAQAITGITKANPAIVTYSGSDTFANGDRVRISGVVGMTEVNNRIFTVANVNTGANTFELSGVNSSGYTTYSSGGTVAEVVDVTTTYAEADIFDLQFAQAGDTVYLAHPSYAPATLVRSSETSWALANLSYENGPWLEEDEQGTYLTPADTGGCVIDMTSNSTSSYTAADSDSSTGAYKAFDRDTASSVEIKTTTGWVSIDFPSTNTKVCDAYWLAADEKYPARTPTNWTFEGYNGSSWIVIDVRTGETTWAAGERRYYDFPNETGYQSYRLKWTAVDGDRQYSRVAELVLHERGASQTAFSLTASAVTGINGGAGFAATDAGRVIRLLGSDGIWRWAAIVAQSSTTAVTIRLYGHALLDVTRISRWQLSPWSATNGYPRAVGFFQDRLGFASTITAPRAIWFSVSADYTDFGISDPVQENDAIALTMTGGELSAITWIEEMSDLVVGTEAYTSGIQPIIVSSAVRLLGPATAAEPFSSFNVTQKKQPLAMLYLDRYKKRLFEFAYNANAQGFLPRELSRLSEHLFTPGIVECFFQADRFNLAGFVRDDGGLTAVTYEPENGIAGITPVEIAGTGAVIESAAAIPSAGGAVIYLVVKRTINGQTRRYVEYLAPQYETGDTLADAVYFDCAFKTTVMAAATVTGITWLAGETIGLLINGVDVGDAVVSAAGTVTLPSTTTGTVVGGLRYTSRLETLRAPSAGNRDGTALGRQMKVVDVQIDMLETKGLQAGSLVSTRAVPHAEREAADGILNTGIFPVQVDDRSANEGVVVVTTNKGYPATIRSVVAGLEGAP
jgi:hypothetical protein